jgi:hypothetical protein
MQIAGLIARSLRPFAGGRIASYDDAHEPRAFGDRMQSWGTSTVLIESGHWPNDPGKEMIRRLNFVALLTALDAISDGSYRRVPLSSYAELTQNGKRAYHIIVRGARIVHGNHWEQRADIGLLREPGIGKVQRELFRVKEVGDLRGFAALEELRAGSRRFSATEVAVESRVSRQKVIDVWCRR